MDHSGHFILSADLEHELTEIEAVARVGRWEWDVANDRVTWSDELYRLFGVEPADLHPSYEGYLSLVHPGDRGLVGRHVLNAIERGESFTFDHRVIKGDGSTAWIRSRGEVTVGPAGVENMSGTAQDVTELKEAEAARDRDRSFLRLLEAVAVASNEATSLEEAGATTVAEVCRETGWRAGQAYRCDETGAIDPMQIRFPADSLRDASPDGAAPALSGEGTVAREAAAAGIPVWDRLLEEPAGNPARAALRESGIRTVFAFPVLVRDEVAAVFEFYSGECREPDIALMEVATHLGAQLGRVVERERVSTHLWERAHLSALLADVRAAFTAPTIEQVLQSFSVALVEHLGVAFARVWLLAADRETLELRASAGMYTHLDGGHSRIKLGELKVGQIAATGEPHLTNDAQNDSLIDREWARREGMIAFAGYPLHTDGRTIGVVAMFARQTLSPVALDLIELISHELSHAIERLRAAASLQADGDRLRSVMEGTTDLITVLDDEGCIRYASPSVERSLGHSSIEGGSVFDVVHPADVAIVKRQLDWLLDEHGRSAEPFEFRVAHADGTWRVLQAVATNLSHVPAVDGVVVHSRDVTESRRIEDELRQHGLHDPLTGLPNRALFLRRCGAALERGRRNGWTTGVIALDVEGFRSINERLGHGAGDLVLLEVARRLRSVVRNEGSRPADSVSRLGPDEFFVLSEAVPNEDGLRYLAHRLLNTFDGPIALGSELLPVKAVAGVALAPPGEEAAVDLVRHAEAALRAAQSGGVGDPVAVGGEASLRRAVERRTQERDLRRALERGEFVLHYQPQVTADASSTLGVEALLRWDQPERGFVTPATFVPLAEDTGLIVPIGEWVIREGCRQAAEWSAKHSTAAALRVSVNVSARQFTPRLVPAVEAALSETGIDPRRLCLEVTESTVMSDVGTAISLLSDLKAIGVEVAIDDFGTGYSSLAYLKRFPLDELKIDRSFVDGLGRDPEDSAIVAAVIGMAEALGLRTVAEGVETADQLARLRNLGCHAVQGFYFARPGPADEVERALVREWAAAPSGTHGRIVIVDDSADILQLARVTLAAAGYEVRATTSATEGLALANELRPDCLLLDVVMPEMNGLDVLKEVRASPVLSHCTVVMLTSADETADKVDAFALGADEYVLKPFAPRDLATRVAAAMRRRRERSSG